MKTMNGSRWGSNPWWHNYGPRPMPPQPPQ
jgi:hypothetical protein